MVREVSESCVDSLMTEMVACYCNRFYANKPELAARRIEAIGYQVGQQLSERLVLPNPNSLFLHLDLLSHTIVGLFYFLILNIFHEVNYHEIVIKLVKIWLISYYP